MQARSFLGLRALAVLFLSLLAVSAVAQRADNMDRSPAELLVERPVAPGQEVEVALRFRPLDGWHGYWANPGDAGEGMRLEWNLPAGWEGGEPQYPVPEKLVIAGLMNHVYEGEHAVLVPLKVPADAELGRSYPVAVYGEWLSCSDTLCVPQWGTLSAQVRVGETGAASSQFDEWRSRIPPVLDSEASFELTPSLLRIGIPLPESLELEAPHVFLAQENMVDYAAPQTFYRDGDLLIAEIRRGGQRDESEVASGIISLDEQGNGVRFAAALGDVPAGGTLIAGEGNAASSPLWLLLGGALLGGLLLNIMPCVFPILSLKALSLARAGESEAQARREGLAYTAGVVLAVLALGVLMLALRAAGNEIGWAFQLQEPGVVIFLLALAVAITANLAGLYELPAISLTRSGEPAGAFATGLLAAFVATPCTGPFMAAAMGAALLLPPLTALLLFAALGLGLALPFLVLGWVPVLRRMLPRPGSWMTTFRKVMAVPMALTALALLWLAWRIGGDNFGIAAAVLAAVLLLALWAMGREQRAGRGARKIAAFGALVVAGIALVAIPSAYEPRASREAESILSPIAYSEASLGEARASGQPVFVWFTADWCVTCKVNEGVAIEREATRAAFEKAGVIAMRGDWTQRDGEITRFLTAQGAAGVPLYMWYPAGGEGVQLPQVLTPDSLIDLAGS